MDGLHRWAMVSDDSPIRADKGARPILGGEWLVIAALGALAVAAAVFLVI